MTREQFQSNFAFPRAPVSLVNESGELFGAVCSLECRVWSLECTSQTGFAGSSHQTVKRTSQTKGFLSACGSVISGNVFYVSVSLLYLRSTSYLGGSRDDIFVKVKQNKESVPDLCVGVFVFAFVVLERFNISTDTDTVRLRDYRVEYQISVKYY